MEKNLTEEILRVCQILTKNSVQYLIVGGTAVAFHGYFRWSQNSTGCNILFQEKETKSSIKENTK